MGIRIYQTIFKNISSATGIVSFQVSALTADAIASSQCSCEWSATIKYWYMYLVVPLLNNVVVEYHLALWVSEVDLIILNILLA